MKGRLYSTGTGTSDAPLVQGTVTRIQIKELEAVPNGHMSEKCFIGTGKLDLGFRARNLRLYPTGTGTRDALLVQGNCDYDSDQGTQGCNQQALEQEMPRWYRETESRIRSEELKDIPNRHWTSMPCWYMK
ncbi:hypothetical protein NDU88_005780 [Pleurodeles waltl]|uniref:Uncharacterized protein n=1 Tax=Pleurodeles waltl TaxID=8319 RepID=A0AAV7TUX9_PLEWA|nr:hypothetical protein NDU88_005780 [Pleurodeles waltl]